MFGYNRRTPISIHDVDYAKPGNGAIREKLMALLADEGVHETIDRIDLITLPKVFGYVFNPVSFFRCYGEDGHLAILVAEVRNTFGEKHHYVLRPIAGAGNGEDPIRFHCAKAFYVSPFNRVDGEYEVRWLEQADSLWLEIDLRRAGQLVMTAGMSGYAVPLTTRSLMTAAIRLPLMIAGVVPRISWQAMQLYLRKRAPVFAKPEPSSAATIPARRFNIFDRMRAYAVRLASGENQMPRSVVPMLSLSKDDSL